jgi:arabinogalactan endo-1,4-beta-galactosidase
MKKNLPILLLLVSIAISCQHSKKTEPSRETKNKIYLGADLSYVNEIEDCGAYYQENGKKVEPYQFFKGKGCNLVRIRLWNDPKETPYSNFKDVKKSIQRAKQNGMEVLLDFHYSDTWADPSKQYIPAAWKDIKDNSILADSLYNFTAYTLLKLHKDDLLPEMVQIGNETNSEILQPEGTHKENIDWKRNSLLLNKGIQAVRDVSKHLNKKIEIMLHIAQPENAITWFEAAHKNNITDYDWIGISYYPLWSEIKFDKFPDAVKKLTTSYKKKLMVVETSYPFTMINIDKANNVLTKEALLPEYPATPQGQKDYLINLTKLTLQSGGSGVVYWEPAWVTSSCKTLWGEGSHWDNATLFDNQNNNEALPGFEFFNLKNYSEITK